MTYVYEDSTVVLGPMITFAEPHSYDLCLEHAEKFTVPRGWQLVRLEPYDSNRAQTPDDLMALARLVTKGQAQKGAPTAPKASNLRLVKGEPVV